jgi:Xaa-Pro aminopeptidase
VPAQVATDRRGPDSIAARCTGLVSRPMIIEDPPVVDVAARLTRLATMACAAGVSAVLVAPGPDLVYLTGYAAHPLERLTLLVVPAEAEPFLVVPTLERPAAEAVVSGVTVVDFGETDDPYAGTADLLRRSGTRPGPIAVDNRMWAEKSLRLAAALPGAVQQLAGPLIAQMRIRKDAAEVAALRAAGAAIAQLHQAMADWLKPGRTEAEVAADIADAMVQVGHRSVDFTIVGSGPNGASPHHESSRRVLQPGDPVVVDIGGTMRSGYCSDCTRTYVAGAEPPPDFVRYYDVLLRAQLSACEHARPGVTCASVDAAAREVITDGGYGAYFIHRTGHGIGLSGHEDPYIVEGNDALLEPGMAFSIEPGIYLPGRHGARIEDIVVVTDAGIDRLDLLPRELVVLG